MKNQELAKIFNEIADYLEMDGVAFKPYAYQRAGIALGSMEEDIEDIYKKGGRKALEDIPGVGKSIAASVEEYLKTGKIKYYNFLRKRTPVNMEELTSVEGLGPKRVKFLYDKLGIADLKDLEKAAKTHKISPLFGFGKKTEENILEGIEFLKRSRGRFLLGEILPKVKEVYEKLKNLKEVKEINVAGSIRRMKETIGDADFLVVSRPSGRGSPSEAAKKIMEFFTSLPGVVKVWGKGSTKASIRMGLGFDPVRKKFSNGVDMDIRVVPKRSYGAALQYFTGSKDHNIALRKIAIEKGLKLSEYGLFKGNKIIAGSREEGVYNALGLDFIAPELRENSGEIEAAQKHKLPKIIGYQDIKGDLHCHSDWDGGVNSIENLAKAAMDLGYEYLGISDHTKFLKIERGLDEKQLEDRNKEIDKLNEGFRVKGLGFRVLKGCEANILNDGSIDIKDETLKKLDFVIAGVHSSLKMSREKMTERMIVVMRNPNVDIISHPTGRILKKRDEYEIDFDKILKVAKETGTILEISAWHERLDLNDKKIRKAKTAGVKMVINTDAHQKDQLRFMELGVSQARRGWAEKEDIINTQPLDKLLDFLK
ncbi:MAG: DNA polymerase/3'-5' exonuclease PolX [Patescibacteria group bacterium]